MMTPSGKRLRITVNVAGSQDGPATVPKIMLVPDSMQQLLDDATSKLDMRQCARRAWTPGGEAIDAIAAIQDGQLVLVSSSTRFPGRAPGSAAKSRRRGSAKKQTSPTGQSRRVDMDRVAGGGAGSPTTPAPTGGGALQTAAKRHAELVDSIRVGERLLRELRQQVEKLRSRSADERQKVDGLRQQSEELTAAIAEHQAQLQALERERTSQPEPPPPPPPAAQEPPPVVISPARADDLLAERVDAEARIAEAEDQAADAMAQFRSLQAEHTKLSASLAASTKSLQARDTQLNDAREAGEKHAARVRALEEELRTREESGGAALAQARQELAASQAAATTLEETLASQVEERAAADAEWTAKLQRAQDAGAGTTESAEAAVAKAEAEASTWEAEARRLRGVEEECASLLVEREKWDAERRELQAQAAEAERAQAEWAEREAVLLSEGQQQGEAARAAAEATAEISSLQDQVALLQAELAAAQATDTGPSRAGGEHKTDVSANKTRAKQGGKAPPTRGRPRGGQRQQQVAAPPVAAAADGTSEAEAVVAAKASSQQAAAEAAKRKRKAKAEAKAVAKAGSGAAAPQGVRVTGVKVAAAPAPAPSPAAAAVSAASEMQGSSLFQRMQQQNAEQEALDDARREKETQRLRSVTPSNPDAKHNPNTPTY